MERRNDKGFPMNSIQPSLDYALFDSPPGWVLAAASSSGLCMVHFCGGKAPSPSKAVELLRPLGPDAAVHQNPGSPLIEEALRAFQAYLTSGTPLPPLPLDFRIGTPFQRQVWQALCQIPFGETRTYLEIAREVNRPEGARAVGQACGRNPLPMIVPCHRVLRSGGQLGGYTGGLAIKEFLLQLEAESEALRP